MDLVSARASSSPRRVAVHARTEVPSTQSGRRSCRRRQTRIRRPGYRPLLSRMMPDKAGLAPIT